MSYLFSRTCIRSYLRKTFVKTMIRHELFWPSAYCINSAREMIFLHERKTRLIEKKTFSKQFGENRPWTTCAILSVNCAEGFLKNKTKFRNIYTSTYHLHSEKNSKKFAEMKENKIFTVPNVLCFTRMLASPILGYLVLSEKYLAALSLFITAGITDMLDGYIARRFPSQMSYFGSILDPIADKILVGVLTVSLTVAQLIPVPLTIIILGRDVGLITASFAVRFISLPPPRTFSRFFDFQLPTVQVTPSFIGKVNTALQLALISLSLATPILEITGHPGLSALQCTVGITTIISGLDYFVTRRGFSILGKE